MGFDPTRPNGLNPLNPGNGTETVNKLTAAEFGIYRLNPLNPGNGTETGGLTSLRSLGGLNPLNPGNGTETL